MPQPLSKPITTRKAPVHPDARNSHRMIPGAITISRRANLYASEGHMTISARSHTAHR
jgi:hypothetical protein